MDLIVANLKQFLLATFAQNTSAYRAINPMGKVPALVVDGAVITEQSAICAWLADQFPGSGLAPAVDDTRRGTYLKWLFFAGNCIEPAYMQKMSGWTTRKAMAGWGNYRLVVNVLKKGLKPGPWLLGKTFSAADVMIGCGIHFGLKFKILDEDPTFTAYQKRCTERPAWKNATEIEGCI